MIRERIKLVNKLHWCLYLPEMLLLKIFISLSAPPLTMIWGSAQLQHKTWSVCPFKSNKGVLQARTSHIFSKESCDPETNMWSFPWHQFTLVIHPWNKEFIKKSSQYNSSVLFGCLQLWFHEKNWGKFNFQFLKKNSSKYNSYVLFGCWQLWFDEKNWGKFNFQFLKKKLVKIQQFCTVCLLTTLISRIFSYFGIWWDFRNLLVTMVITKNNYLLQE